MNTNNFLSARTLRRQIVKSLKEQQQQDSSCSERLRIAISRHTRAILNIVSELLLGYTKSNLAAEDRSLFLKLTPTWLTPELWLQNRAQEGEAALELTRIKGLLNSAEAEFSRVAPFGKMVTGWFSNPQEKARIDAAKGARDRLRREHQQVEANHHAKLNAIHSHAEHFLRGAMTTEGLTALLENSSVRSKLREALEAMNRDLADIWRAHSKTQFDSLERVRSATCDLFAMYNTDHPNTQTPLLGAVNAATRN